MSKKWHRAPGTYVGNGVEITKMCEDRFGPQLAHLVDKNSGEHFDNHGNWRFVPGRFVEFRYKQDLTLFLLLASHLADPDRQARSRYFNSLGGF